MLRVERNEQIDKALTLAGGVSPATVRDTMRELCRVDLFFLLTRALGRKDADRDWLYDRCVEVQAGANGFLDLWAREHYKSTIITFSKTIQDILINPEITVGIFSHTKPIARAFLRQIKYELETNEKLKVLFPDVLHQNPKAEAPSWSEDKGITVKRKSNPKEATVEAHGLVDGQPTSRHFSLLVYDDVVTKESVFTSDQIKKTTEAWELSTNLAADGGVKRYIGTRYHFNDTYKAIMDRGSAIARIYPATDDGTATGTPVLLSKDALVEKRRDQGVYTFGCQMLQNPKADQTQGFQDDWLNYYSTEPDPALCNFYIIVDPANEKKKASDNTAMWVLALAPDRNYYIIDFVYDKLNLTERTDKLFELHREYLPLGVGYEQYGMQADIQHIESEMERVGYRFNVTKLGGNMPKNNRIRRLVPKFELNKIWFPRAIYQNNFEGKRENIIYKFITEEYQPFPVGLHDDGLDCLARVLDTDLAATFPKTRKRRKKQSWQDKLAKRIRTGGDGRTTSHMAA